MSADNLDAAIAVLGALSTLVRMLHEKKIIDINDYVANLGNTIDFANVRHMSNTNEKYDRAIYEHFSEIAALFDRLQSKRPE